MANDNGRGANPDRRLLPPPAPRTLARQRVSTIDRRCRIARMADKLMPLSVYYATRWPE